ncbi:MAG: cell wall hydrolase [Zavarzinia sp.]|nr:cell wall hydrolase [Zavarzinia sp.]
MKRAIFIILLAGVAACARTPEPAITLAPAAVEVFSPVPADPVPAATVAAIDRACLIATLYFEAGGEGAEGMAAVGHVVLNRLDTRPAGTTICDVVYERHQFGWTPDVPRATVSDAIGSSQRWQNAAIVADAVLEDTMRDPTSGAHSFYSILQYRKKPRWARNLEVTTRIGNHVFMR